MNLSSVFSALRLSHTSSALTGFNGYLISVLTHFPLVMLPVFHYQDYNTIHVEHGQLKQKVLDNERTLEELGIQLSQSKLQVNQVFQRQCQILLQL